MSMGVNTLIKEIEELTGKKIGRFIILGLACYRYRIIRGYKCGVPFVKVLCECGKHKEVRFADLRDGRIKSCGCLSSEMARNRLLKHGCSKTKLVAATKAYKAWRGIISRCYNESEKNYYLYGGRGIIVCNRWRGEYGFINFLEDMGDPPTQNHSIERINVDGNYELSNCKWATRIEQANNKRNTKYLLINGVKIALSLAASQYGLRRGTVFNRIKNGYTAEEAVTLPLGGKDRSQRLKYGTL